jgi:hypothetical protein
LACIVLFLIAIATDDRPSVMFLKRIFPTFARALPSAIPRSVRFSFSLDHPARWTAP